LRDLAATPFRGARGWRVGGSLAPGGGTPYIRRMAKLKNRLPANAAGDFYVDASCIDCGTCRWVAPASFADAGSSSFVRSQPQDASERLRALMALAACPTGSIGTVADDDLAPALAAFPERIAGEVYHCGYHAKASFGAASYLIRRQRGNVLVDSPRFTAPLVRRLEELGGVALMLLTHQDDVADHRRFRAHFGCERILHLADRRAETRDVERWLDGSEPVAIADDLLVVPVPGHTRGSVCLLHEEFLFSGDHVSWRVEHDRIGASREVCWYDWEEQTSSMRRLAEYRFDWILPGHGRRCYFAAERMATEMRRCIDAM
jgi:glyoxylase-like metal-dependent hydrolase (beta-lactamase superfamily II)/ferredoxin